MWDMHAHKLHDRQWELSCKILSHHFQDSAASTAAAVGKRQALHVQVLRFFCVWDDRRALFGDRRPYRLHYFLEDGSCEILETREANSGREPFPVFLRRAPLPKVRNAVLNVLQASPWVVAVKGSRHTALL